MNRILGITVPYGVNGAALNRAIDHARTVDLHLAVEAVAVYHRDGASLDDDDDDSEPMIYIRVERTRDR